MDLVRPKAVPILLTGGTCVALYFVSRAIPEDEIRAVIAAAGTGGPALFCLLLLVPYVVAPLSSSPLLYVGFRLFGQDVVLYAAVSGLVASLLNFWIARRFGRHAVERLVGHKALARADQFVVARGPVLLILLRVFNGGVYKFVAYAAGLTAMRFHLFAVVSAVGMLPGTALWYAVASRVDDPLAFTALSFTLGVILAGTFAAGAALASSERGRRQFWRGTHASAPTPEQIRSE